MSTKTLGRLEKIEINDIWDSEPQDFTPWLAKEENLLLLSETIGITLELEAQEKNVGAFRADILCKDIDTNNWVLIENQFKRTDHSHLGQILTYAAGLKAFTVIWIAERFTDEHRATLDWLNEITGDHVNFFGLEVEVWKIGSSEPAPKFNIVCMPNDWSKSVSEAASILEHSGLSDTKLLQQEFWAALRKHLLDEHSTVRPQKALPQHWTNFSIGRSLVNLAATVNTKESSIGVELYLSGPNAKSDFKELFKMKSEIEKKIGSELKWEELPERKASRIILRRLESDINNKNKWDDYVKWLRKQLELFHKTFGPIVKTLGEGDE